MQEILNKYQIRKTNKQKENFIEYLKNRLYKNGYTENDIKIEESGKWLAKTRNVVIGNPDNAKVIIGAHYDTPAVSPMPNFMCPINVLPFILSQLFMLTVIFFTAWVITIPMAMIEMPAELYVYSYEAIMFGFLFWLMFGYQNKHCANDNTSGTIALIKILEELPKEKLKDVCIVFFDNEEKGLWGSTTFVNAHKSVKNNTLMLNLDCIGDGTHIATLAPKKTLQRDDYKKFVEICTKNANENELTYLNQKMKPMMFGSDQAQFKHGVGICALNKHKLGFFYCDKIHTRKDKICKKENIDYLSNSIIEFIQEGVCYDRTN